MAGYTRQLLLPDEYRRRASSNSFGRWGETCRLRNRVDKLARSGEALRSWNILKFFYLRSLLA